MPADSTRPFVVMPTRLGDTAVMALWTGREAGDMRMLGGDWGNGGGDVAGASGVPSNLGVPSALALRRVRQVHGSQVVVVGTGQDRSAELPQADALVAGTVGWCLAILVADCAPLALGSLQGVYGAVHVGWRGLIAGVVEESVRRMRSLGAEQIVGALGPCIRPCCFEFSADEMQAIEARIGKGSRGATKSGALSLDLPAAVRRVLEEEGVALDFEIGSCTACSPEFFSWRRDRDDHRQALLVWREP